MIAVSSAERRSFEKALCEFDGLTNEQAYVHIFSKRMMEPIPNQPGEFFGCDQRLDMLPPLQKLIAAVPENGQILDVGAGAGDIVDFALKSVAKGTTIHIEEPNTSLIKVYLHKLSSYHLNIGSIYTGPLQDYYRGKNTETFPQQPQNLILAIHMLYHLTDFTQAHIDPAGDLIEAFSFLYGLLAKGGTIFIVYADLLSSGQKEAVGCIGEHYFRQLYPEDSLADHLRALYQARNQLLGPGGSLPAILADRYPSSTPILHAQRHNTHFFGKSIADIAALALLGELCPSNSEIFELNKLQFCFDYILRFPKRIGLQKEEGAVPQRGMWRANQPQVLAMLNKC